MKSKNWFEVSKEGLKELQAGKDKEFVVRELIQNAWDEDTVCCYLTTSYANGMANVMVEDDSPEGFRDITHAFTLFAPTYKRGNPEKRGRFNIGEKQVLAICQEAVVSTTKGTVVFNSLGRTHKQLKRERGSIISVKLEIDNEEYDKMMNSINLYLPPKEINFAVNGNIILYKEPNRIVSAILPTELQREYKIVGTYRKTSIHIHKADVSYVYEMGLPICKIDCPYSIDVQQKVPMSIDRERISQSYLRQILTVVFNEMYEELSSSSCSDSWVREAMSNKDVKENAVRSVIKKRYGDKVVVADARDRISIDKAISEGYRVVWGSELSAKEWDNIRKAEAIPTSSTVFPTSISERSEKVVLDGNMILVGAMAKKIAKRCLGIDVSVRFAKWKGCAAQYGCRTLTFNVEVLGESFFNPPVSARVIDLVLHELAHEKGMHTQASYLDCLSAMAGELVIIVLEDSKFFERKLSN